MAASTAAPERADQGRAASASPAPTWAVVGCAALGLCPVGALVAWAYRLGSFQAWFWGLSFPSGLALLAIGLWAGRRSRPWHPWLGRFFAHGVVGGVLGACAYDLIRVPFLFLGDRLLSPIDSYGVLLLNASTSSPLTSFAGWWYHFADGIGFGIAYAVVMRGRNWRWGLAWGMTLETISLVTPLGGYYGLRGAVPIVGAYIGHLAYGSVLGKVVELAGAPGAHQDRVPVSPRTPAVLLVALVAYLLIWLRPWTTPSLQAAAPALGPAPAALIVGGRFYPQWLRVPDGGCVTLRNTDRTPHVIGGVTGRLSVVASSTVRTCFRGPRVHRVKLDGRAWSGGFVIVDPALR